MDERVEGEIHAGLENIGEMFQSCEVRGEQFTRVAIASFEAGSAVEIYTLACSAIGSEGDEDLVNAFGASISHLMGSLVSKIGHGMDEKTFNEAVEFGVKAHEQKLAMQERVQKIIKKDH